MAHHSNISILLTTLLVFTGLVVAEWQVLNAELDDSNDDVNFMPVASKSSSTASSTATAKSKGNKKHDKMSLAQKTYQTTEIPDPWSVFQNVVFSPKKPQEKKDVVKMTSANKDKPKHNFKSTQKPADKKPVAVKSKEPAKATDKSKMPVPPKSVASNNFDTKDFRVRELLVDEDYNGIEDSLKNIEEFNADLEDDEDEAKVYGALLVEEERRMMGRKAEEWKDELDCNDPLNQDVFECLYFQDEKRRMTDEANISEAGYKARQQLMDFMELNDRQRRAVGDEGSGSGNTYPEDEVITDGRYNLKNSIIFRVNASNSTDELTQHLKDKLTKVFEHLNGFVGVTVKNVNNGNGVVKADWTLTVRGNGIGAYGGSELDIANGLQFQLLNLSKPLYDQINLEGANPENPLDTREIADEMANSLENICESENPCSSEFDSCTVTGYDEGKCLHKCAILEQNKQCQHGGYCEMEKKEDGTTVASCQCTHNWEGPYCESRRNLNKGEIAGATVGAALAVAGIIGACCWLAICRRRRKPVSMTYFGDDSDSSERFSSPSSRISTFVIDRPRIRTDPIRSFSPHSHDDFSRPSSISSGPPNRRPRAPANLFSDA